MSWSGTVRCSNCYENGHNITGCPDLKKAWEKAQVAREEREAQKKAFLEEKARRAAALDAQRRTRRDKKNLMRKKTKRGQPVMKHRVQSILDKLTADASS